MKPNKLKNYILLINEKVKQESKIELMKRLELQYLYFLSAKMGGNGKNPEEFLNNYGKANEEERTEKEIISKIEKIFNSSISR